MARLVAAAARHSSSCNRAAHDNNDSINRLNRSKSSKRVSRCISVATVLTVVLAISQPVLSHRSNNIHSHHHREHREHTGHNFEHSHYDPSSSILSLVLPHDTYPGFSVKKFTHNATTSAMLTNTPAKSREHHFHLLESEFSKYFTVLDDGTVMTTSDLSPLVNRPVHLTVLEDAQHHTQKHQLQLFVMDKKDMLHFPGATLESIGEVPENAKPGTKIHGIPLLQANSVSGIRPIDYTITSGNENKDFALENSKTGEMRENITVYDVKKTGVWLVTNRPLDREAQREHLVIIHATDEEGINIAEARITVNVRDMNDNRPIFKQTDYRFTVPGSRSVDVNGNATVAWARFTKIGKVEATDADGDKIAYKLKTPNNVVVIVPQTGELLLAGDPEKTELTLEVEAHDIRTPSLTSAHPAKIHIEFVPPTDFPMLEIQHEILSSHHREKRRVTRAVRPTKRIEFTEADGDTEGRIVFTLEKETERETFKIRDENPWVTVETNGAVRVKKKWDYEELGPEKTIDFWVIITNQGGHNCE